MEVNTADAAMEGNAAPEAVQAAAAVLMVRPRHFASNPETLASNRFQSRLDHGRDAAAAGRAEFDALVQHLDAAGVEVHVLEGRSDVALPDEVFPNNWVSFHADGTVVLYPMMAPSRRLERRADAIDMLRNRGYDVRRIVDLTGLEQEGRYLEGTGSLVLDHSERVGYACLSPRTTRAALDAFAERVGYDIVAFEAVDAGGHPVYHTNVMLSVGTRFAVVARDAIAEPAARAAVVERLARSGRDVIDITPAGMQAFAGNILELRGRDGPVIALSATALAALDGERRRRLEAHATLVATDVPTIETCGGGSVRCMLAEVGLPRTG